MANISTVAPYAGAEHASRPGIFRRILAAIMEAQQRKADREVRAILARYADMPPHVLKQEGELEHRYYPLGRVR
jgi:hypothetical protein